MNVFTALNEFCIREYEDSGFTTGQDILNAKDLQFVYTDMFDITDQKEVEATVSVDLTRSALVYKVDGRVIHEDMYENGAELADVIYYNSFDELCGWLDTYSSDRYEL